MRSYMHYDRLHDNVSVYKSTLYTLEIAVAGAFIRANITNHAPSFFINPYLRDFALIHSDASQLHEMYKCSFLLIHSTASMHYHITVCYIMKK